MGLASRVRMFLLEGGYAPLAELECSLGLMGLAKKTNKLPANPIAGQVFSNLPNSIEDTRPCTCSVHVQE